MNRSYRRFATVLSCAGLLALFTPVAHGLASGVDLETAVRKAVVVGALAATRRGAQPSMPTAREAEAFLELQ